MSADYGKCKYCGKPLVPRMLPYGYPESPSQMRRKVYCDRTCMRKAKLKLNDPNRRIRDCHGTAQKINELFLHKENCEMCGKTGKLDVHHKDKNPRNNSLDNLMVLCRSCHSKIHKGREHCYVCGDPQKGLNLCEKHIQRFKKYGNPLITDKGKGRLEVSAEATIMPDSEYAKLANEARRLILSGAIDVHPNRKVRKVCQYTLGGKLVKVWKSGTEAAKALGYCDSAIYSCCKGKRPHHHGYLWRYEDRKNF